MKRSIFVLALVLASCAFATPNEKRKLNSNIWFPSTPYNEAIQERSVNVIIAAEIKTECDRADEYSEWFFGQTERKYAIGELCDELFVFVQAPPNDDDMLPMVISHESFHLLAQLSTMRMPLAYADVLTSEGQFDNYENLDRFFNFVMLPDAGVSVDKCERLDSIIGRLSEEELDYMKWRIFAEWPAQYYTMLDAFGEDRIAEFYTLTERHPGFDHSLYVSAIEGIKTIESKFGKETWQTMLYEGFSLFDMYQYSLGCTEDIHQYKHFAKFGAVFDSEAFESPRTVSKDETNRTHCGDDVIAEKKVFLDQNCGSQSTYKISVTMTEYREILGCAFNIGDTLRVDCTNMTVTRESKGPEIEQEPVRE